MGPVFFIFFHFYADTPRLTSPYNQSPKPQSKLVQCLSELNSPINSHFLELNTDKLEDIIIWPKYIGNLGIILTKKNCTTPNLTKLKSAVFPLGSLGSFQKTCILL